MGKAHTAAYKNLPLVFGNDPMIPILHTIADVNIKAAKDTFKYGGFKNYTDKELGEILKTADNITGEIYKGLWHDIGTPERLNSMRKNLSL